MGRLINSLDTEDRIVGAGIASLVIAGALIHVSAGLAVLGIALVAAGIALARRAD